MNESTLQNKTIANLKVFNSDSLKVLVRTKTLNLLIQNELIYIILENLNISKEQYENELKKFKSNNKLLLEEDFQSWLKANNQTEQSFELNLINELKYEVYRNENFSHKVEAEFLKQKEFIDNVTYSLIRVKDPYKARELALRISNKEDDFASIASEFTEGPEKSTRGIIGPVPIQKAHPVLAEILRKTKPGELKGPIRLGEWFLLVRVEQYTPAILDEELSITIKKELMKTWIKDLAKSTMDKIISESS